MYGITSTTDTAISNVVAWAYDNNTAKYPYDPAKAEALLDEAGYKRGADGWRFHAPMPCYQSGAAFGQAIKQMLAKVGIDVDLKLIENTTFFSLYQLSADGLGDDIPFAIQTFGTGPDPIAITDHLQCRPRVGATENLGFYCNPQVDKLLAEAANSTDQNLRKQDYYKVQEIIAGDVPIIYLWNNWKIEVWKNEFDGFRDTNRPIPWWGTYRGVWWTKAQPLTSVTTTSPAAPPSSVATTTSPAPPPSGADTTTIAAVIVIIVAVAAAALYLSRRKKK